MEESVKTKVCSKCGKELPVERFSKSSKSADGLQCICKSCISEYNKKRYYDEKKVKEQEKEKSVKTHTLIKVYSNPELAKFQPRELIAELRARGYSGELHVKQTIVV